MEGERDRQTDRETERLRETDVRVSHQLVTSGTCPDQGLESNPQLFHVQANTLKQHRPGQDFVAFSRFCFNGWLKQNLEKTKNKARFTSLKLLEK